VLQLLIARAPLQEPEASLEGLGGTYFFMNEAGKRSAIVKPCDEEPLAPCNPKVSGVSCSTLFSGVHMLQEAIGSAWAM